jgi:large subunit ribosomal protein L20
MRGTRYSRFINGLQRGGILLNRKMLSQLAIDQPRVFDKLIELARAHAAANHAAEASETPKPNHAPV